MRLAERAESAWLRARAAARILPHVPEIRRGGHASAAAMLERRTRRDGDRLALAYLDERYSWAEVNERANRFARYFLRRGVAHGDVVALVMDNRPEYVFALLGLSKIRAIGACVNTHLSGAALEHALRVAHPALVLAGAEHLDAVSAVALPDGRRGPAALAVHADRGAGPADAVDDAIAAESAADLGGLSPLTAEPMAYLYTSGTTGLPKAAVVTNQRFIAAAYAFGKLMHEASAEDVIYVALPLYHGTGQWGGLGASLATGAAVALRRKFSASAFFPDVVRFGATRITYIGELCRYLVHQPPSPDDSRHHVRVAVGNGLRPDVWPTFQNRFGIPLIREFYGATEGNSPIVNLEGRPGMLGRIGFGQALVACDRETGAVFRDARGRCRRIERSGETGLFIGRISIAATFDGYVDERATSKKVLTDVFKKGDAWFDSGDLLTMHEGGWLSFADRVGDTFRWKGENVSTAEVSSLLNVAPGVLESNVYGVVVPGADGRAGMASLRVTADFDVERFAEHVARALPKYARPRFVRIVPGIQVTATLKHQKVDYRSEGYDPERVADPLYYLRDDRYVPLDREAFAALRAGAIAL